MGRRRLVLKKAERSGAGASDVKKAKYDLAELNFIIWLVPYIQSRTRRMNLPLAESTCNCSTKKRRKESYYEIEWDGNDEGTFANENFSNSGYNVTADADTESVCSTEITKRKISPFKKHKKLPVKDSDMQTAVMGFLRAMKGYIANEEE